MDPQKTTDETTEPSDSIKQDTQTTVDDQAGAPAVAGQSFSPTVSPAPSPVSPTPQVIASTAPSLPRAASTTASVSSSSAEPDITPSPTTSAESGSASTSDSLATPGPIQPQLATSAQPGVFNPAEPSNSSNSSLKDSASGVPLVGSAVVAAKPSKRRRRILFAAVLVVLIAILGGGYAFAFYLPNTPENIFKHGLSNTGLAYDKLTDFATAASKQNYKGTKVTGTMTVDAGGISGDGSFNFQNNGANATGKLNVDFAGEKLDANIRSVQAAGAKEPDVYFQVNGVKSVLDKYGYTMLDSLDGKWISVDHTLIKSVTNTLTQGDDTDASVPTPAQVQDALTKVGKVNNQYIFKADASHAVLKQDKYLGKSTFEGRSVYGYQTGYDRAHLQAYVAAIGDALDSSSLNTWSKAANGGKSLSTVLQISELKKQVTSAKESYTFKLYVDAETKLVANVHFTGDKATDSFDIGQTYNGGDVYPFVFKVASGDDKDGKTALALNVNLNSKTNEVTIGGTFNDTTDGTSSKVSLNAKIMPSNDAVNVTAPTGAISINTVLAQLGLLGSTNGSSSSSSSSLSDDSASPLNDSLSSSLFTLTQ